MRFGDELDERGEGDGSIKDGSSICGLSNKVPVPEMKIGRKEFVGEYQSLGLGIFNLRYLQNNLQMTVGRCLGLNMKPITLSPSMASFFILYFTEFF